MTVIAEVQPVPVSNDVVLKITARLLQWKHPVKACDKSYYCRDDGHDRDKTLYLGISESGLYQLYRLQIYDKWQARNYHEEHGDAPIPKLLKCPSELSDVEKPPVEIVVMA